MAMARRNDAPSVRIIGHKKYILEKRNLLCEATISDRKDWIGFSFNDKIKRLYFPRGKEFILETVTSMTETILETIVISEKEAHKFMDQHPEGIKENVYVRYFGEPEEV